MSGSIIFTEAASSSITSSITNDPPKTTTYNTTTNNKNTHNNSNRLAPYNPTHATAQSSALDLLHLTPHDVFFDLGCGDGRLVIAALERCYDDDYLMRVHQDQFAKLHLKQQGDDLQPPQPASRQEMRTQTSTPTSTNSLRKIHHSRSYSTDYSVPHLLGNDDYSDTSGFDSSPYHHRGSSSNGGGSHSGLKEYGIDVNNDDDADGESENSGTDVLSALSPTSQRKLPLAPESPITPIACNRGLGRLFQPPIAEQPPSFLSAANTAPNDYDQTLPPIETILSESIPKTIETPSPNGGRASYHASQISELPTMESIADHVDVLLSSMASMPLMSVPSGDVVLDDDESSLNGLGGATAAVRRENQAACQAGAAGVEIMGGGLQCIGIEYNQALAETAQSNVKKSFVYQHVERKVCIRWGDVLEEWNGSCGSGDGGKHISWNEREHGHLNAREGHFMVKQEKEYQDGKKDNASELNLIKDATAVFVYLLPQGLKKVRPLLYEAAVLRRRQQEQQEQQQQEQHKQPHPLHHPLQQCSLHETEEQQQTTTEYHGDFCPLPQMLAHRKDYSHVSDITDYDFRTNSSMLSMDNVNSSEEYDGGTGNLERVEEQHIGGDGVSKSNGNIPSFRVVSYMFSIPGWTPTKVDRSSKGACPLYLYENIHEEEG